MPRAIPVRTSQSNTSRKGSKFPEGYCNNKVSTTQEEKKKSLIITKVFQKYQIPLTVVPRSGGGRIPSKSEGRTGAIPGVATKAAT